MSEPLQKPAKSRQDYATPWDFIYAVERRFGPLAHDLAAAAETAKATSYFSPETDALDPAREWHTIVGNLWLNPPFADIEPWAAKCKVEAARGARILLLTPASVGSAWFAEHVHRHAMVFGLGPRIKFVGEKDAYPKDLMLSAYGFGVGFDTWYWKERAK